MCKKWSSENEECGKYGVENGECEKYGVKKFRNVETTECRN